MIVTDLEVTGVERLSPTYLRIELGGEPLAEFGVAGPLYDQRIKLIFPGDSGRLPSFEGEPDTWYERWLAMPEAQRGHLRTYSVRDVRGSGADTRLVIDFVLHLAPGATGPAARWAADAEPGRPVGIMAPRRGRPYGGIEFAPGSASRLLLAGDETAVPAISRILADLPAGAKGAAFVEVPLSEDVLCLETPNEVSVTWLPRNGAPLGRPLTDAVLRHLGMRQPVDPASDDEVDPDLWETPGFSSGGEQLPPDPSLEAGDAYAWIAGESGVVTTLRRHLVRDLGIDRRQVAFMGYWRRGVAMRS